MEFKITEVYESPFTSVLGRNWVVKAIVMGGRADIPDVVIFVSKRTLTNEGKLKKKFIKEYNAKAKPKAFGDSFKGKVIDP